MQTHALETGIERGAPIGHVLSSDGGRVVVTHSYREESCTVTRTVLQTTQGYGVRETFAHRDTKRPVRHVLHRYANVDVLIANWPEFERTEIETE